MIIETQAVGPFFKNGYVVGCEDSKDAVLIDPGDEVASLLAFAERAGLAIRHILLTHAHVDHITGVAAAKRALDVPIYLHRDDLFLYERVVEMGAMFGLEVEAQPPVDLFCTPFQIAFGGCEARVSYCGLSRRRPPQTARVECGQRPVRRRRLLAGSIGSDGSPGGDYSTLIASIRNVLLPLGDDAIVHSGHGPDTTIGEERRTNPFLVNG